MLLIQKALISGIFFIVIPFIIGNGMTYRMRIQSIGMGCVFGWVIMLASYEIAAVPAVFLKSSLTILSVVYSAVLGGMAVVALVYLIRNRFAKRIKERWMKQKHKVNPYLVIALVLLGLQFAVAVFGMHTDADDAYYVGTATTSVTTDTLYAYEPDNGLPYTYWPTRYIFSALMTLWAYISKITSLHPLAIAHTIIPVIFIGMFYIICWNIGKILLKNEEHRALFFLFLNVFNVFGYSSVYTQPSFLEFRIWQGKAMLPNFIFPILIYLFLYMVKMKKEEDRSIWNAVFWTVLAGCCCSSMAVPLCALTVGSGTLVLTCYERKWKIMLSGMICCLPCILIGIAFLVIK